MTNIPEIPQGTIINQRYQVEKHLGQGGFGRTYLVKDTEENDKLVVLKEFAPSIQQNLIEKAIQLFQREAEVLSKLDHPQIPKFLDSFEIDDQLFLVQEYIEGKTYVALLNERQSQQQNQVFSEAEIIQWLKDILSVLDYIHSLKIIHRDISPDNIMLSDLINKPILIDFGVGKKVVTEVSRVAPGSFVGKVGYSPDEQIKMGECYPNSDLYSLAITALVLLTGKLPEQLFDSYEGLWKWQEYVTLETYFADILNKMLANLPKDRYSSASEVLEALESKISPLSLIPNTVLSQPQTTEIPTILSPPPQPPKPKSKVKQIVFTSIALISLTGTVSFWQSPHIPILCKIIDNCARDKEFQAIYEEAINLGDQALSLEKNAKNIEDLTNSKKQIQEVINSLTNIPNNVKIYSESQKSLGEFKIHLQAISKRLAQEILAKQQLEKLQEKQTLIQQETDQAKTITNLKIVKEKWSQLGQEIQKIPSNSFLSAETTKLATEYQAKIINIDAQINQLIAEEKRRQEAARIASTTQPKTTKTSTTTSRSPKKSSGSSTNQAPRKTTPKTSPAPSDDKPPPGPPLWGDGSY